MKRRGIETTGADFWAHVFPEAEKVFWFPVIAFIEWNKRHKFAEVYGFSKDGTKSGRGYCLPKDAPFVMVTNIPSRMLAEFRWDASDRERGKWGEEVFWWMCLVGIIRPPVWAPRRMTSVKEQYEIGDFELSFAPRPVYEVKTEGAKYAESPNIFIQTEEEGHKVHLVRTTDGELIERVTSLPPLKKH